MSYTEAEFSAMIAAGNVRIAKDLVLPKAKQAAVNTVIRGSENNAAKSAEKKSLVIRLPFKLPTWNCLLAANPWQRKKIRDFIHSAVSEFTPKGKDSLTQMEYQQKRQLMALSIAEYYRTITPKSSAKSATRKSSPRKMKRSLR